MRNTTVFLLSLIFFGCQFFESKTAITELTDEQEALFESIGDQLNRETNIGLIEFQCDSLLHSNFNSSKTIENRLLFYKARALILNDQYEESKEILELILPEFESEGNAHYEGNSFVFLSIANTYLGNFTQGNFNALRAKKIGKTAGLSKLIIASNSALSFIAYRTNDLGQALILLQENEKITRERKDSLALSTVLNNIAVLYKNLNEFDASLKYNRECLEINKRLNVLGGVAKSYDNIGLLKMTIGQTQEAVEDFKASIEMNKRANISNLTPYLNIAVAYIKIGNYAEVNKLADQTVELTKQTDDLLLIKKFYETLLEASIKAEDLKKTREYLTILENAQQSVQKKEEKEWTNMLKQQQEMFEEQLTLELIRERGEVTQFILWIVIILFLIFILYILQKIKTISLKSERNKISLELQVLRSQMNPHFIFNVLTAIQSNVLSSNSLDLASSIAKFSQLIRQNFEFSSQSLISLAKDIDALKNYMETQRFRLGNTFDYRFTIDKTIDRNATKIPPMLMQPFVENAIEHGFKQMDNGGIIQIRIALIQTHLLHFEIEDNGCGYSPKRDSKLHAIDVIKKRLKLLNQGDEKSFSIQSLGDQKGTRITFNIYHNYG